MIPGLRRDQYTVMSLESTPLLLLLSLEMEGGWRRV